MQTFIVKISKDVMTPADIREALWVSGELSREDITVERQ
jgi:hypothetical protein